VKKYSKVHEWLRTFTGPWPFFRLETQEFSRRGVRFSLDLGGSISLVRGRSTIKGSRIGLDIQSSLVLPKVTEAESGVG
jgi:hypothetical protein